LEFARASSGQDFKGLEQQCRILFRRQSPDIEEKFSVGVDRQGTARLGGIIRSRPKIGGVHSETDEAGIVEPPPLQRLRQRLRRNERHFEPIIQFANVALRCRHERGSPARPKYFRRPPEVGLRKMRVVKRDDWNLERLPGRDRFPADLVGIGRLDDIRPLPRQDFADR
jgi:hypothetical protein